MADDEDVLFEGSPLYGHLKEAGFTEFEYETKTKNSNCKQKIDKDSNKHTEVENKEKKNWYGFLKKQFHHYIHDDSWKDQIASLHKRTTDKILASAFKQPILATEDACYIENFSITLDKESPVKLETASSIYGHILLQISVLVITISYGLMRMFCIKTSTPAILSEATSDPTKPSPTTIKTTQPNLYIYGLDVVSLIVTIIALLPASIKFSSTGKTLSHLARLEGVFEQLLTNFHTFARLSNKATLFIQESEVIRRGFTLLTAPISRLEQSMASSPEDRNYIDLRRSIYHRNRNILLAIRHTTTSIIQLLPPSVELKGVRDCLAGVELSGFCNFIPPLGDDGKIASERDNGGKEPDEEIFKLTDGYSLTSIKYLIQLTQAHMADLLRVTCLYACIRSDQLKRNKQDTSLTMGFEALTRELSTLEGTFERQLEPFRFYFEVCKNLMQTKASKEVSCGRDVVCEDKRDLKFVYMAVHSLLLHLQAATQKVLKHDQALEQKIEAYAGKSDEDGGLVEAILGDSEQLIKEVVACKECLQQLITFHSRKKHPPAGKDHHQEAQETFEEVTNTVVLSDVIPVVQDEVFEIVTSNEKEQREETKDFDDDVGSGKSMAGVLSELQSVISERAVMMAEREKIALGRFEESLPRSSEGGSVVKDGGDMVQKDGGNIIKKAVIGVVAGEVDGTNDAPHKKPWSMTHEINSSGDKGARPKELKQYYGKLEEASSEESLTRDGALHHSIHFTAGNVDPQSFNLLHPLRNQHQSSNGFACNRSTFKSGDIFKDVANMAASLGNQYSSYEEHYNDDDFVDEDDEDEMDEEDDDDDDIVSDSQSNDIDSDDIYHVTDDDEGFDGVNNACDYDDDDDGVHLHLNDNDEDSININNSINNNINISSTNTNNININNNNLQNNTNDEVNDNSRNEIPRAPISNHHAVGGVSEHEGYLY